MGFKIIPTSSFKRNFKTLLKKHKSLSVDFNKIIEELEANEKTGIPLGKNCYKLRLSIKSKGLGKSGGARVITCVKIINETVYLISIFDKSNTENITDKQLTELLKKEGLL